jgi:menaquinone-dependent protoporphyrinogen IX oxidase
MRKAVVYYSKTGNTEMVAKRFIGFDMLKIMAESDNPNISDPKLIYAPELDAYDYIVFASPVHGFQLSRVMVAYLNQVQNLEGKLIDIYITHFFPFAWMGGNQTLRQMKKMIKSRGGEVRYKTSINWSRGNKEQVIKEMIDLYHN